MKIKLLAGLFLVSIIAACTDEKGKSTDDDINSSDLSDNLPVVRLGGSLNSYIPSEYIVLRKLSDMK